MVIKMEIKNYEYVLIPNILAKYKCNASGECCKNKWKIDIDEVAFLKTKSYLDELKEDIGTYINIDEENGHTVKFTDGYCKFITDKKLCRIHKDFGWDCLSDTCKVYPRILKLTSRGMEMSLVFSCRSAAKLLLTNEKFKIIKIKKEELFFMKPSNVSFIIPENNLETSLAFRYYKFEELLIDILNDENKILGQKIQYMEEVFSNMKQMNSAEFDFEKSLADFKIYKGQETISPDMADLVIKTILIKQERSKNSALEYINLLKLIKLENNLEADRDFLRDDSFILTNEELIMLKKLWNKKYENILKNYLLCYVFNKDFYYTLEYAFMKMIILGTMLKFKILLNKKYLKRDLTDDEIIYTIKSHDNDFSHDGEFFNIFYTENKIGMDISQYIKKLLPIFY